MSTAFEVQQRRDDGAAPEPSGGTGFPWHIALGTGLLLLGFVIGARILKETKDA